MTIPKYAALENERRFLVTPGAGPDLTAAPYRLIEDLYLREGRLRLRRMTDSETGECIFKLCKKYESGDPTSGPIVNLYLSSDEFAALAVLPGQTLVKRRYAAPALDRCATIDVFEGELAGLVLCEMEAETPEAVRAITPPDWVSREVTTDLFFTGGQLCRTPAAELAARLSAREAA